MSTFSGQGGAFSYGGTDWPIDKWSITKKGNVADVTDSSSTYEEFVATGYVTWNFTFEGYLKSGVAKPTFHSEVALIFTVDTGVTMSGTGIITDESTSVDVVGTNAVKVTFSGQGTGTLTEANP